MKKIICIVIALFLISGINAQKKKYFTTRGTEIIGPDGKPFIIRGTNLGNWLVPEGYMFRLGDISSPSLINETFCELIGKSKTAIFWQKYLDTYITEADVKYLKEIGVNSLRLPFNYKLFTNEDYLAANDNNRGFKYMDKLISWCKKYKIYIILDMHCAAGGQTGDNIDDGYGYPFLFDSEPDKLKTIGIWKRIATRYSNEPIILGYDLLNEPIATYFDPLLFNAKLEPLYKRITAAIRSVDKNHIIILGGSQWDSNFKIFGTPFDSKLVYTFHKYWTPPTQEVIQQYIDFSNKFKVPIYCGETGENTDGWVDSFRVILEKNKIGWHFWPYKKPNNLKGFVQFTTSPLYDSVIAYAAMPRNNFALIRNARPKNVLLINKALEQYIENASFKNCFPNQGYIKSLGFNERSIK